MIPNSFYYSHDVFRQEMDRVFPAGFEFVCLLSELREDKDFVCIDYQGCAVVVQNFKGELKAFKNVCSHRFNKIQFEDKGNRPLTCRYHGWSYNAAGLPIGVANRIEPLDLAEDYLCLTRYRIEVCGQFVFVARNESPQTLREFLGVFHDVLENLSASLGPQIHFGQVPHKANWKVLVENVIDNQHCALLHRETFVSFGFCRTPVEEVVTEGLHSSWHVPRTPMDRDGLRRRALSHLQSRTFAHDSFYHIYIFPNLFIASTEGISFYIGHALPLSAEETLLRVRYHEPAVELKPSERVRQDLLNEQTRVYGLEIVEEDRPILESIQKGVQLANNPGVTSKGEPRIREFMDRYMDMMRSRQVSEAGTYES
ncbi:MAG TPA: SRPBCC family protein [Allosphingosinicella sp.]|nr:SRPBCC family protein [Allosphingosinicella sp.]